jgi:hypothetical protein
MLEPTETTLPDDSRCAEVERRLVEWQIVEWLGIRARLPSDWEITRHAVSAENGSLVFVDRRRQRLTLTWTQCRNKPDLARLVRDYGTQRLAESSLEPFEHGGRWRGLLETRSDGERVARVVTYEPRSARLLEAVLVVDSGASVKGVAEPLLDRLEVTAAGTEARRFGAFGLCVETPEGMQLARVAAKPMELVVEFRRGALEDRARRVVAVVQRLGMAGAWYRGDLERTLRQREPGLRFAAFEKIEHEGWPALLGSGTEGSTPFERLRGRARRARALAWHCRSENAVYVVCCRARSESLCAPAELRVACEPGGVREG